MYSPSGVDEHAAIACDRLPPTDHEIAALAYRLWTERGCPGGSPDDDWFRAEALLKYDALPEAATARPQPEEPIYTPGLAGAAGHTSLYR